MLSRILCKITKIKTDRNPIISKNLYPYTMIYYTKGKVENFWWYMNSIPEEEYRMRYYA